MCLNNLADFVGNPSRFDELGRMEDLDERNQCEDRSLAIIADKHSQPQILSNNADSFLQYSTLNNSFLQTRIVCQKFELKSQSMLEHKKLADIHADSRYSRMPSHFAISAQLEFHRV